MSSFRNVRTPDKGTDVERFDQKTDRIHILSVGSLDHGSLVHDALTGRAGFRLSIATDYPELWLISRQAVISAAILHRSLSLISLDAASRFIRRCWPQAHILVLRNGNGFLEHDLFDSCMKPNIAPIVLLEAIEQQLAGKRNRRFGNAQR